MEKKSGFLLRSLCKRTDWSHGQGTEKDFLLVDTGIHTLCESTKQTWNLFQMMLNICFKSQCPECWMAGASSTRFAQGQCLLLRCRWNLPSTLSPGAGASGKIDLANWKGKGEGSGCQGGKGGRGLTVHRAVSHLFSPFFCPWEVPSPWCWGPGFRGGRASPLTTLYDITAFHP